MNRKILNLNGNWKFAIIRHGQHKNYLSAAGLAEDRVETNDCNIPSTIELDLFNAGKLPDPFFGMNPVKVREETEFHHCYYTRKFNVEESDLINTPVLVLNGLDCIADIYINQKLAAQTDNMLIKHTINIADFVLPGENEIFIHIKPAVIEAEKYDYPICVHANQSNIESVYIRKAPHMYGWDIMPRFVSAGIWRDVEIEFLPNEYIKDYYMQTVDLAEDYSKASIWLNYNTKIDIGSNYTLSIEGRCKNSSFSVQTSVTSYSGKVVFSIDNPELWWPRNAGEQNLYKVKLTLYKDNTEIDQKEFNFGVRTAFLSRTSITNEKMEGDFTFIINHKRIFARGSNWVPMDAFHSRDNERIPRAIELAVDLECNMLRCWGGNVYEDSTFFDLCDKYGIMVWQDFAMACALYPQDDEFCDRFRKEAISVVKSLRQHPSLVLWSGDNENDAMYTWWGNKADPNKNRLTREIIPEVLRQHDPLRSYICSSPYIDEVAYNYPEKNIPENHLWGPRDYFKSNFYVKHDHHFVSETGYHGCPSPESMKKFISPDKLWPYDDNPEWILHSTSPLPGVNMYDYRVKLMANQIKNVFGEINDGLKTFSFASQCVQAEAFKFFIENMRVGKGKRSGILWWNLIDGWPQLSDAIVDYYYDKKLAYYYIKNSQSPFSIMFKEQTDGYNDIMAVNDLMTDIKVVYKITDLFENEKVIEAEIIVPANTAVSVAKIPFKTDKTHYYIIEWNGDVSGKNHYLAGNPLYPFEQYAEFLEKSNMFNEFLDKVKSW